MFGLSKEEKKRQATRDRVRRYREKQKASQSGVTGVTEGVTPAQADSVTAKTQSVTPPNKMACKCPYFRWNMGQLVCAQCGQPSRRKNIGDKILQSEVK